MESHIKNLSHPKKRKHVFENVAQELISQNFEYSAEQCLQKWKSLERSYNLFDRN